MKGRHKSLYMVSLKDINTDIYSKNHSSRRSSMTKLQAITPPFPTGKSGSFVSSSRPENPIKINYLVNPDEANTLYGDLEFRSGAEGPPGHIHGGCQAAVLDELMGSCCWANKHPVVAKKIEVEFIKMLPMSKQYKLFAKIEKIEGRKVFVTGQILADEEEYAKGSGLFIILNDSKIEELKKLVC